jgi:hypothetical protein
MGKTPHGERSLCGCKFSAMKSAALSQNKNLAGTQLPVRATSSNQTAIAPGSSRAGAARSACAYYLTQGTSSVSMKLIAERASISAPVFREIRDEHYEVYAHGGLND